MTAEGAAAVRRANRALVSALVLVVVLAAVAPFAAFGVPQLVGADRSYVVLSGSMEPYMSAGDAVVVAAGPAASIRKGDVITYERGGGIPTTHRVVERVTDEQGVAFRTMGDANEDPDPALVRPDSVVGEVVVVLPYVGYVVQFANTPIGILSLVVVPIGLLVLSEGWRYTAARRRRKAPTATRPAIRRVVEETDDARAPTSRALATPQTTTGTPPDDIDDRHRARQRWRVPARLRREDAGPRAHVPGPRRAGVLQRLDAVQRDPRRVRDDTGGSRDGPAAARRDLAAGGACRPFPRRGQSSRARTTDRPPRRCERAPVAPGTRAGTGVHR
jgi:signal peptidase I